MQTSIAPSEPIVLLRFFSAQAELLSLRVAGAVAARNYSRSSFPQWACGLTRTWAQDVFILSQVVYPLSYPVIYITDIDECATLNGGCSQKCNNDDGSYHCSCFSNDYKLDLDGKECIGE